MGRSRYKRSYIELGKDGKGQNFIAHGATAGSYMKWDQATDTLKLVNADFDVVGDIEIEGDVTLTTEDISLILTKHIYFAGQGATEYINSADAGYLDLAAATAIRPGADLFTDRWLSLVSNTLIGMEVAGAGNLAAGGTRNTAVGYEALYATTTAARNVAIGYQALKAQTSGTGYNVAVGDSALATATSAYNTAVGRAALASLSVAGANYNTGIGDRALTAVTEGIENTAIGARAGMLMTTGAHNILVGYTAGDNLTTADHCIIIGYNVDAPSATVDAQIKIGGGTAAQGYILGDSAGDMMVNAVTGKTVEIAVAATAVGTFAGALITLAQITSITNALEASAVGTASLKTAGGLGVAAKAYIGTDLVLVAGPLDMSTVAEDILIKATTIAALEMKVSGGANLLVFDTRNAITGVSAFLFTVPDIGFASAAGSTRVGVSIDPGTMTFTDTQAVTAMEGLGLYISAHTFAGTAATVAIASTVYIASAPASGGSVTVTAGYALHVGSGTTLMEGALTVGEAGSMYDVNFYGESDMHFYWNASTPALTLTDAPVASTITGDEIGFTATMNATEAYTGWALGYFGTTTLSNTSGTVGNAAGGCFEVNFSSAMTGGVAGMVVGAYVGAYSSSTTVGSVPTAGLWVETIATNSDMSATPVISIVTSGSGGTTSEIAFALGNAQAGKTVSTGLTGMYYNETIHIIANAVERYIPLSTVAGTYTTAYPIISTSTIATTIAALTVGDAYSGIRSSVTCDNPNNGYGASGYFQADITGTQAAHFYGFGSWINIANAAIGGGSGKYLCAQDNGIYVGTPGGEWANTLVIFGMRAECIGLDSDTLRFPFSINTGGTYGLTALFDINSLDEMSKIASATAQSEYVPIFRTSAGDMRYVRLYVAS